MLLNGRLLEHIDSSDRGLAYGDGAFETIRLLQGKPLFLQKHLARLKLACKSLGIGLDPARLDEDIALLSPQFGNYGVLKIIISRGTGGRGYRPDPGAIPTRILSLHLLPDYSLTKPESGIQAFICRQRMSLQPALAGIKHLNRLEQVLASMEWPDDGNFMEGIMLDLGGRVIEGTRSNIFIGKDGGLLTPDLSLCGINGVMRSVLLEAFPSETVRITDCYLEDLMKAEEVFLCNSIFGVWPVLGLKVENQHYELAMGTYTHQAQKIFKDILASYEH